MSFPLDCTVELCTPLNQDMTVLSLYPLSEAQKWLYTMLPLAYSCNLLLAKTRSSLTILDKPEILELLVCIGNPFTQSGSED